MLRFLLLMMVMPTLAFAQEAETRDESYLYAPEFCEFSTEFPSDPYTTRRCGDDGQNCEDVISYTQVYDMQSTVNFRVICRPISEEAQAAYTEPVMKAALRAMTKQSVVDEYNTSYREEEVYKQAGLVGEGVVGRTPMIFVGQLWVGKASVFSVEAELIGEPMEDADTLFRDVLNSVGVKQEPQGEEDSEEEDTAEESEEAKGDN